MTGGWQPLVWLGVSGSQPAVAQIDLGPRLSTPLASGTFLAVRGGVATCAGCRDLPSVGTRGLDFHLPQIRKALGI